MASNVTSARIICKTFLFLGLAGSLGANLASAKIAVIPMIVAGFPALTLFGSIEMITHNGTGKRPMWQKGLIIGSMAIVAGISAWISYWHIVDLVTQNGQSGNTPYLYPFAIDAMMVIATVKLTMIPSTPVKRTDPAKIAHTLHGTRTVDPKRSLAAKKAAATKKENATIKALEAMTA